MSQKPQNNNIKERSLNTNNYYINNYINNYLLECIFYLHFIISFHFVFLIIQI